MRSIRRGAPVMAALLLAVLTGCSASVAPTRTVWPPGLTLTLENHCLQQVHFAGGVELEADGSGWTIKTGNSSITDEPDQVGSIGPSREQGTGAGPVTGDALALVTLERCMDRYPIDYSMSYTDTIDQRLSLYDWDVRTLVPCLVRAGWNPQAPPSRATYAGVPYGTYDPYGSLLDTVPLARAKKTLAACPDAPVSVVAHARAVVAARGIQAVR